VSPCTAAKSRADSVSSVTVVLGLLAALCYGIADFAGGLASRTYNAITVLLYDYPLGAALMIGLLPVFPGTLTARAVLFGTLGGAAGLLGVSLMYGLMTVAPMNVISPVTAVLAAIVPVIVGVGIGERPATAAWVGIALGMIAVILVSRTGEDHPHGRIAPRIIALAFLAGVGFGLYFVFLARAGTETGLWPLVVSRIASAVFIVPIAFARRAFTWVHRPVLWLALGAGACDAFANMFFLLAARHGLLSLASVLTALYPAFTVMLAVGVLHEHLSRVQLAGLTMAAASVVLITI
jgi:drug/metabolite transporter (DMT)-like permease